MGAPIADKKSLGVLELNGSERVGVHNDAEGGALGYAEEREQHARW